MTTSQWQALVQVYLRYVENGTRKQQLDALEALRKAAAPK